MLDELYYLSYWHTWSIAQPLCDSRDTCFFCLYRIHRFFRNGWPWNKEQSIRFCDQWNSDSGIFTARYYA